MVFLKHNHLGERLAGMFDPPKILVQPNDDASIRCGGGEFGESLQGVFQSLAAGDHGVNTKALTGLSQKRLERCFRECSSKAR